MFLLLVAAAAVLLVPKPGRSHLRTGHTLKVSDNKLLREAFGPKSQSVT